jgi:hypothetical protein
MIIYNRVEQNDERIGIMRLAAARISLAVEASATPAE